MSLLERAEYYDKWRALKDDIEQSHGAVLPPTNDHEREVEAVLQVIIKRMDEYEDGTR